MVHSLRVEALSGPTLSDAEALIDYLTLDLGHAPAERFRILFLDSRNRLLSETTANGTINEAPVYPREVMRHALEIGATALILAHNHPSGDPMPGRSDIQTTHRLVEAGRLLGIVVHDHVIVSRAGWTSLRALGLLAPPAAQA